MKSELEEKLAAEFSFMKKQKTYEQQKSEGRISDLYGAFGCDVGDGWYTILYLMCQEIFDKYKEYGAEVDFLPAQIKEKFGQLRVYFDFKGHEKSIHAIDILGRFSARNSTANNPLHKEVEDIVRKYEEKSITVCEICGSEGTLRTDLPWIQTLCDDCYSSYIKRYNK